MSARASDSFGGPASSGAVVAVAEVQRYYYRRSRKVMEKRQQAAIILRQVLRVAGEGSPLVLSIKMTNHDCQATCA
jgi:hypothetical protein